MNLFLPDSLNDEYEVWHGNKYRSNRVATNRILLVGEERVIVYIKFRKIVSIIDFQIIPRVPTVPSGAKTNDTAKLQKK